jgi:hemoglobin/transferrin/lactoferrin receptor protein
MCNILTKLLLSVLTYISVYHNPVFALPQLDDSTSIVREELIFSATRSADDPANIPANTFLINQNNILKDSQARSLAEVLSAVPGVKVQKTAYGQSSPYIRGFTGFRTLLLIDGIRLNNSVFRDGPNQYSSLIDHLSVKNLEVLKGSSSILYGSDAIGGLVNAVTSTPDFNTKFGGQMYYRNSLAESSSLGRIDLHGQFSNRFAFALGLSAKSFGELKPGDSPRLKKTAYDERDVDLSLGYQLKQNSVISVLFQNVVQDDVWRTHKTIYSIPWRGTIAGSELKRSLDHERNLIAVKWKQSNPDRHSSLHSTFSFHRQDESRHRVRTQERVDKQGISTDTYGWSLHAAKELKSHALSAGFELYHDAVDSYRIDSSSGEERVRIQGAVADDSFYDQLGIYFQDDYSITKRFRIIPGVRFTKIKAEAGRVADPLTGEEFSISRSWEDIVSCLQLMYHAGSLDLLNFYISANQSFRAPNLSDISRYDSNRSNEIETPAPNLSPESFLTFDGGVKLRSANLTAEFSVYHTIIDDMIIRVPTGNVIDEEYEVTKLNSGKGYSQGFEFWFNYKLNARIELSSSYFWLNGEIEGYPDSMTQTAKEPLSRMMPQSTTCSIRYQVKKQFWVKGEFLWADKQDKLSSSDAADLQRIPPGGTPGYSLINLRSGYMLTEMLDFSLALENITDKDYRIHGSGQNEPGRNLVGTLIWNF